MDIVCRVKTFTGSIANGVYIWSDRCEHMSSVLIWSIESVLLGLWALVLSAYSTPFHVFIARSHILISSFTLLLQMYVKARRLVVGSAVSQAFVCAVSSLFISYVSMMVHYAMGPYDNSDANEVAKRFKFFKLPLVGLLTLDACIGLAWFIAAFISSLGMAFSFSERNVDHSTSEDKISMMFHGHGVHLPVVFPCLIMMFAAEGASVDGNFLVCVVVWGVYVLFMFTNLIIEGKNFESWQGKVYITVNLVFTKYFLVIFTLLSYMLHAKTFDQKIIVLSLLVVSVVSSLDVASFLSNFTMGSLHFCFGVDINLPELDSFFGKEWKEAHEKKNRDEALAEPTHVIPPPATAASAGSMFNISPLYPSNRSYSLIDPAAVSLNQWKSSSDREKIV